MKAKPAGDGPTPSMDGDGAAPRIRYQPGSASEPALARLARLSSYATAPVGGSGLLFPARLARTLETGSRPSACASLSSVHARRFFRGGLTLWTDPRQLTHRLHDRVRYGDVEVRLAERFVDAADWTDVITPVPDVAEHRETVELVRYRANYMEMPAFGTMLRRIGSGRPVQRYGVRLDSEEKLHCYFRYFLGLIDSIEARGFQEQRSLEGVHSALGQLVRGKYAARQHDIGAALGADGGLLRFLGGRHRTAIAQALGLAAVPVEIRLVHADWLAAEVRRTGSDPVNALCGWVARVSLPPPRAGKAETGPQTKRAPGPDAAPARSGSTVDSG